jgi:hypothetical protein
MSERLDRLSQRMFGKSSRNEMNMLGCHVEGQSTPNAAGRRFIATRPIPAARY